MQLTAVLDAVAAQADDFVARVCAMIREQYPGYLAPAADGFDPLVAASRRNFLDALRWIRSEEAFAEADMAAYRTAFLRNAYRDAAVTDVLGSLRLGFQEIWLALDEASERLGGDADLRVLTSRLWRAYERLAGVAAQAYAVSQRRADVARQRDLIELWRHLSRPNRGLPAVALARELGLDPGAHYLAWASASGVDPRDLGLDEVESVLLPDVVVGFVVADRDVGPGVLSSARAADVVCGIGARRATLSGLYQSALDARRALAVAQSDGRAVRFDDDLIGCLAFDPTLGLDDATAPVERELQTDPAAAREVVLFLENGRALRATARELGVHPNTLAYRLRRFWARTGLDPDRAEDMLQLALAARRVGSVSGR